MTNLDAVVIVLLALVVAAAAAARSTWSPCGLSMLSTITPMAERSRGHRYGVTATWFIIGAGLGGLTIGAVTAALAAGMAALDLSATAVLGVAAVAAAVAALIDAGAFGRKPPFFRRQVDDAWLSKYRAWVYGGGFGWQIGFGLATYIMTAGVVLTFVLAALTGSPLTALGICVFFGLCRGLVVLVGARISAPAALAKVHERLDALEAPVRWGVVGIQVAAATVTGTMAWGPLAGVAVIAICAAALAARLPLGLRQAAH